MLYFILENISYPLKFVLFISMFSLGYTLAYAQRETPDEDKRNKAYKFKVLSLNSYIYIMPVYFYVSLDWNGFFCILLILMGIGGRLSGDRSRSFGAR